MTFPRSCFLPLSRPHRFAVFLLVALTAAAFAPPAAAQTQSVRGWLHVIWDVGVSAAYPDGRAYLLVGQDGGTLELDLSRAAPGEAGEILSYDRNLIEVAAERVQRADRGPARTLLQVQTVRLLERAAPGPGEVRPLGAAATTAARAPFITILCRFADDAATPFTRTQIERMVGPTYPGMAHYFAELAGEPNVMADNRVTDWYTLPLGRSAYVQGEWTNWGALVRDCTAAADPDVFFPAYFGVNLQFNGNLSTRATPPHDVLSFGGSFTLSLDGETRTYGMTWMSGQHASNYVVLAHEMGHGLGWPHSSGRYGQEYDSRWDLMSAGYLNHTPEFGWLSIHTIASHKDHRGWIPAARRWEPAPGTRSSGVIARTALPPPGTAYLMARIPLRGNESYTVETRRIAGYDARLPGEAVLIHHVQGLRSYVVDADNNGDPNDHGAMWLPGETFADSINGVAVRVDSATATGFGVTLIRGWLLEVAVQGRGRVSSSPAGIDCGTECTLLLPERGRPASLTATPEAGWHFLGWSGACSGTGACELTLNGNRAVSALFVEPLAIASDSLRAGGILGAAYGDTLQTTGGTGSATWTLASGALPRGLALDTLRGVVAGIPEEEGTFRYALTARSGPLSAARAFQLSVTRPVLAAEAILDQLLGSGSLTADQLRFLDLIGNRNGRLDVGDVRAWLLDNQHLSSPAAQSLRRAVEAIEGREPGGEPGDIREPAAPRERP